MKTLILMSVAVLTLSGTAHARGEHCRLQDNSCQQNYRKADAFKYLYEIEGSVGQAEADLQVIEQINQQYRIGFEPAMGNFVYLMNVLGGSASTDQTQTVIKVLAAYTNSRLELAELVDGFVSLYQTEGSPNDALTGIKRSISLTKEARMSFQESLNLYEKILNLFGGSSSTAQTVDAFNSMMPYAREFRTRELFATFKDIYVIEGNPQQTIQNLNLIVLAARKCGSLSEAKEEFLSLLNSLGGSSATDQAQQSYRRLFDL